MNVLSIAEKYRGYGVDRRRFYHAHPELSGEEMETRKSIEQDLRAIGISDIKMMKSCFGLIADIPGRSPGKTVALRTDTDALKVEEKTGLPFAAANGCMHACGHDIHIAILLEAAQILWDLRDTFDGTVRLIVQPAEEVAQGAKAMIAEGALQGVDAVYGNHVHGDLIVDKFCVDPGATMSSCHYFSIEVEGYSSHGSAPHEGVDAIAVSAAIINALQQVVSRMNNPVLPLVLTVGTIQGGVRFNTIANHVTMEGTVRTYEAGTVVEERMRRVIEQTAKALGAKASLQYDYLTPPMFNDEKLAAIAKKAVEKTIGADHLMHREPVMGSEDFAFYGEQVPILFSKIGTYDQAAGHIYANHHEKYAGDEILIHHGAIVMAQFALDFLTEV